MAPHTIDTTGWEEVGPQLGTRPGAMYENPETGERWYVKSPTSQRQLRNEVLASAIYRDMALHAVEVHKTADGRVASKWVDGLPESTTPEELTTRDEAFEAFLPSALIANWDVIGLEYDNMLPDPADPEGVVLLDFGGAFDTRAMGGSKPYSPTEIPALDGFLDLSINPTAPRVFREMTPEDYGRSKDRLRKLDRGRVRERVEAVFDPGSAPERAETILSRLDILLDTSYAEVFE